MAKNIEMNIKTSSGYDVLYPTISLANTTGILSVAQGGTGVSDLSSLKNNMGISDIGMYSWEQATSFNAVGAYGSEQVSYQLNHTYDMQTYQAIYLKLNEVRVYYTPGDSSATISFYLLNDYNLNGKIPFSVFVSSDDSTTHIVKQNMGFFFKLSYVYCEEYMNGIQYQFACFNEGRDTPYTWYFDEKNNHSNSYQPRNWNSGIFKSDISSGHRGCDYDYNITLEIWIGKLLDMQ